MKNCHLTFEERVIIEEYLNKGIKIHKIALKLNRPDSSIVREIKRNRSLSASEKTDYVPCKFQYSRNCKERHVCGNMDCFKECQFCYEGCNYKKCKAYVPSECEYLTKSPFVCNGCTHCEQKRHRNRKYKYYARKAQGKYEMQLKECRKGISITSEEMEILDTLVSPLLINGQSIRSIYMTHKDEIPVSESTLYEYVDRCYLTARNIDMPRKVRFKARYNHGPRTARYQTFVFDRTYADFKKYIEENPDLSIWEMDTVIGKADENKCLLTLLSRRSTFMIAVLLEKHTQEAVINALNELCETLGIELFQKIFQVILTDRGQEFGNPYALECDQYGEIKTRIYYCDPYCSWQKGMIERNHEFIRMFLPKGKSFENLSQKDVHLMMTHINNYPRESLNCSSPFELSRLLLGKEFLDKLHFHKIRPDDVILKEKLLKKT